MNALPDEEEGRRRSDAIDVLRGLAIVLVVIGHSIQWTDPGFDDRLPFRLIYSFHMPLFFFISGVVGARGIRRPLLQQLRSRALGLLVPFVSWWFVLAAAQWIAGGPAPHRSLVTLIQAPDTGLWFLWVLFVTTMVAAVALALAPVRAGWAGLLIAALVLYAARLPVLGFGLIAWYFPFFAAGIALSERFILSTAPGPPKPGLLGAAMVLAWLGLAFGWHRVEPTWLARTWAGWGLPLPGGADLAVRYVTATAGIAAAALVVRRVPRTLSVWEYSRYLGCNTLEVYVGHALFLAPFAGVGIAWAPVAAVVAGAGSLLAARLLKRVGFLRVTLYGGRA